VNGSTANIPGKGRVDRTRAVLAVAFLASVCAAVAFGRTLSDESAFFSTHSSQKTIILRIPGELAHTEREIRREQRELLRIQAEITRRLVGK
jgi:hypothetical protein